MPMASICLYRKYRFSSSHRLHSGQLSEPQNLQVYDKCNNINGHGHDYTLEVGLKGSPDLQTGMIIDLTVMDNKINQLLKKMDYYNLDKEVDLFRNTISTGENIIQVIWRELDSVFDNNMLYYLKLWETNNNYFEYCRDFDSYV